MIVKCTSLIVMFHSNQLMDSLGVDVAPTRIFGERTSEYFNMVTES